MKVKCPLEPSPAHLWAASTVIVTAVAAESTPPTPPPVAKSFVRVLVGFGVFGPLFGGCRPWSGW
eukprot:scaffold317144_cov66-Cyclotella_meneghiniana.AAC.1